MFKKVVAASALMLASVSSEAVQYIVTPLALPSGGSIMAVGIGPDGTIVGRTSDTGSFNPVVRAPDGSYAVLPTFGGSRGIARAVNAGGIVVGYSRAGSDAASNRPFVFYPDGTMIQLPIDSGANFGSATDINDSGLVVGSMRIDSTNDAPLRWDSLGNLSLLTTPIGYSSTSAYALNSNGQILGNAFDDSFVNPDVVIRLDTDGSFVLLDTPLDQSLGFDINDASYVVGQTYGGRQGATSAVVWSPAGAMLNLGALAGDETSGLTAINNAGVAVGFSATCYAFVDYFCFRDVEQPVTWTLSGGMKSFVATYDLVGFKPVELFGINDAGQILARSYDASGVWTDYLLTPEAAGVPEPTSWAMLIAGFGIMGGKLRRRRSAIATI